MKEIFLTKPPGAITRSRHNTLYHPSNSHPTPSHTKRSQSDSATVASRRPKTVRVLAKKHKLNTPFELRAKNSLNQKKRYFNGKNRLTATLGLSFLHAGPVLVAPPQAKTATSVAHPRHLSEDSLHPLQPPNYLQPPTYPPHLLIHW